MRFCRWREDQTSSENLDSPPQSAQMLLLLQSVNFPLLCLMCFRFFFFLVYENLRDVFLSLACKLINRKSANLHSARSTMSQKRSTLNVYFSSLISSQIVCVRDFHFSWHPARKFKYRDFFFGVCFYFLAANESLSFSFSRLEFHTSFSRRHIVSNF